MFADNRPKCIQANFCYDFHMHELEKVTLAKMILISLKVISHKSDK